MQYLVHIGYPKAASTWLQSSLFSGIDPQIQPLNDNLSNSRGYQKSGYKLFYSSSQADDYLYFPSLISPFDFDAEEVKKEIAERTPEDTKITCLSNEVWTGHPFSGGITGREFADRIHAVLPQAKILVVIRRQEDMILSTYGHFLVRVGGLCSLERFLMSKFHLQMSWHSPLYYRYDFLINYYIKLFGENNVLVLPFELLQTGGHKCFVEPIYHFVGIKQAGSIESKAIQNARDYNAYAVLRVFRWINMLAWPHPANGNASWAIGHVREVFINFAKFFFTQTRVNNILEKDRRIIAAFIKPYALESNRNLQKRIPFNLRDLGYTI